MTAEVTHQDDVLSLIVDKGIAAVVQEQLQHEGLINREFKPRVQGSDVIIPLTNKDSVAALEWFDSNRHRITVERLQINTVRLNPGQELLLQINTICDALGIQLTAQMIHCVPKKWELYGDLAIIPNTSFNSADWQEIFNAQPDFRKKVWETTAMCLHVSRLARQAEIADDRFRSSQVTMLLGNSGEVQFTDFGVKYWLDVTKVMFSSGNVTERHRIGSIDMTDECVIDAFAGIGYYTLPMLVRSNAKHVYALELNPDSVFALERAAEINGVNNRLTIIHGDNQITLKTLVGTADRVSLGILPSSESTWLPALECLKKSGGILHIHTNVRESEIDDFIEYCLGQLSDHATKNLGFSHVELKHIEKVKWYAPHVRHIVIDVAVS